MNDEEGFGNAVARRKLVLDDDGSSVVVQYFTDDRFSDFSSSISISLIRHFMDGSVAARRAPEAITL